MQGARKKERAVGARWRELAHIAVVVLTVGLLTGLSPACNGGDNGGNGTDTTPCLRYESSGDPVDFTVTTRDGESGECNFLFVDLWVHEVEDLFAANFVVTFPSNLVAFAQASGLDSVLASGNTAVDVEARVTVPGEVSVGITRVGVATGVNVDPTGGLLVRLVFSRVASSGSGTVEFTTKQLLDSSEPPQTIPDTSEWSGGTIGIIQT
jgi:hypothetical protein